MIKDNKLYFGYGDIAVGSNDVLEVITFQQFKPPLKCGDRVDIINDVEYIGEKIIININYDDYFIITDLINDVLDEVINEFEFKGYVFNFDKFNIESFRSIKFHLSNAIRRYTICLAC